MRNTVGNNAPRELMRFGVVGLSATAVHYIVLTLTVEKLLVPPFLANGIAFVFALLVTYVGQSLWVFHASSRHGAAQVMKFAVSISVGLIANVGLMALSVQVLHMHYSSGFLLCVSLVPIMSFAINKNWVFKNA